MSGFAAPVHKRRGRPGLGGIIATNISLVLSARAHKNEKQGCVTKQEMSGFAAPVHKRRGSSGLQEVIAFTRGGEGFINKWHVCPGSYIRWI